MTLEGLRLVWAALRTTVQGMVQDTTRDMKNDIDRDRSDRQRALQERGEGSILGVLDPCLLRYMVDNGCGPLLAQWIARSCERRIDLVSPKKDHPSGRTTTTTKCGDRFLVSAPQRHEDGYMIDNGSPVNLERMSHIHCNVSEVALSVDAEGGFECGGCSLCPALNPCHAYPGLTEKGAVVSLSPTLLLCTSDPAHVWPHERKREGKRKRERERERVLFCTWKTDEDRVDSPKQGLVAESRGVQLGELRAPRSLASGRREEGAAGVVSEEKG
ncbi:hypothetical protein B0O80DRAFT_145433 [Mortierella sp. GBAus27b]|nr:hypothetical protein B0O80DRAFT_145433 [Mortierella sp. GBAus27b]